MQNTSRRQFLGATAAAAATAALGRSVYGCRKILDLPMPRAITAAGGIFEYKDRITTPDTLTAQFRIRAPADRLAASPTVRWDADTRQIPGNPATAGLLKREYRKPWEHPYG